MLEVTMKLSEETVTSIAEKMIEIQQRRNPPEIQKQTEELQYTVNEVASMCKRSPNVIRKHITKDKLLIAEKVGKSWLISQTNYNKYTNNEQ